MKARKDRSKQISHQRMREKGIPIEEGAEDRALKEGGYYKWSATWCTPSVKRQRRNTE